MEVILANKCGFCPGVTNAISIAEKLVASKGNIYSLGPIIHNPDVVENLANKGLKTVNSIDEIEESSTVLIRSHGAAPAQIDQLKAKGAKIVDATCVLVKRLQQKAIDLEKAGYEVVVIGDKNHPEVKGVVGCVGNVVVISSKDNLCKLPKNKKLGVVCQTTKGPELFGEVVGEIVRGGFKELKVINTLCKETVHRQESAVELCKNVDIMFVLGGLQSANTHRLVELCKKHNNQTFHLQNWKEFDKSILSGKAVAGVTAGASTPQWVINEFVENLKTFKVS
jgi:4-hydroxy-3-methylbut-2-enyl diphosphate reductase